VLTSRLITESVCAYWSEVIGIWLPTIYPGREVDSTEWREWNEINLSTWRGPVQRSGGWERLRVHLTCHVFVRSGANLGRGAEIAERIRLVTNQACLPVVDSHSVGGQIVGHLRLYEPEVKNLSRTESDPGGSGIEQWTIGWKGFAEESGLS